MYLKVLLLGQRHLSSLPLGDCHSMSRRVVVYVGLDARLVKHVGDILPTGCMRHTISEALGSFFGPEKPLHKR